MSGSSSGAEARRSDPIRVVAAAAAAAHAGWIWWLSSQSFKSIPSGKLWGFLGNSFHFLLFGVLALLLAETCRSAGGWSRRTLVLVFAVTVLYGIVDELHQRFTPGRSSDPADVCVDLLGALAALLLWWGVRGPGRFGAAFLRAFLIGVMMLTMNAWRAWGVAT